MYQSVTASTGFCYNRSVDAINFQLGTAIAGVWYNVSSSSISQATRPLTCLNSFTWKFFHTPMNKKHGIKKHTPAIVNNRWV